MLNYIKIYMYMPFGRREPWAAVFLQLLSATKSSFSFNFFGGHLLKDIPKSFRCRWLWCYIGFSSEPDLSGLYNLVGILISNSDSEEKEKGF